MSEEKMNEYQHLEPVNQEEYVEEHPDLVEYDSVREAESSVGFVLRAAREKSGQTVADIARRFKLRVAQVEAVEAEDWARLPGRTFARGMVRSYAKAMGLDPESLVMQVLPEEGDGGGDEIIPSSTPAMRADESQRRSGNRRDIMVAILGVLLLLGAILAYFFWPESRPSDRVMLPNPTETAPVTNPAPAAPPGAEQAASAVAGQTPQGASVVPPAPQVLTPAQGETPKKAVATSSLRLVFVGDSWVEIKDGSGNIIFSATGKSGTESQVEGELPMNLHIGNAAGVKLNYKGSFIDMKPYITSNIGRVRLD